MMKTVIILITTLVVSHLLVEAALLRGQRHDIKRNLLVKKDIAHTFKVAPPNKVVKDPILKATKAPTFKATKTPTVKTTKAPGSIPVVNAPPTAITAPAAVAPAATPKITPAPSCPFCPSPDVVWVVFVPAPTREPTFIRPTQSPTREPTRHPTFAPTIRPTRSPTYKSTRNPTAKPTRPPSSTPTQSPTARPTETPTFEPTRSPRTWMPSPSPTQSPTDSPTQSPSLFPTPSSPFRDSITPIKTNTPTLDSLAFPMLPTKAPEPTTILSSSVSEYTMQPTFIKNEQIDPSTSSSANSELVVLSARQVELRLLLSQRRGLSSSLNDECISWVQEVERRIHAHVKTLVPNYETINVIIYNPSTLKEEQDRVVSLQMDVMIRIRTTNWKELQENKDELAQQCIEGPWDTPTERLAFAAWLRENGDCAIFDHVADMAPVALAAPVGNSEMNVAVVAIILSLLACCCCAMCGIVGYRCHRNKKTPKLDHANSQEKPTNHGNNLLEIACDAATNDISTLGDPIGPYHAAPVMGVSTVGSTSLDYDYQVAFGQLTPQATDDGTSYNGSPYTTSQEGTDAPVVSNDVSAANLASILDAATVERLTHYELVFRVVAPAGPLGFFLQSHPVDGRPMVLHVKHTSCLAACIQPGDCLLVVNDDIPVTAYTPSRVSQLLIALLQQERAPTNISLVFSRPRTSF